VQDAIIYIDSSKPMNLQNQIRLKLVDGILNGAFPPGMKLPSSRKLAQQLEVARNTVVAAYQQLVAEGYLVSRQRSGIFVNKEMLKNRVGYSGDMVPSSEKETAAWKKRTKRHDTVGPVAARELPNRTGISIRIRLSTENSMRHCFLLPSGERPAGWR